MINQSIRFVALFLLYFYQHSLGVFFGGACRFYPSCSHYAVEAYKTHSAMRATYFVALRLSKCRPGGPYGIDLVPNTSDIWQNGVQRGS